MSTSAYSMSANTTSADSTSANIDLEQTRRRAKELLKLAQAADPESLLRIQRFHPERNALQDAGSLRLADCQLVIARELGYLSWAALKQDQIFRDAVAALDSGDLPALSALLQKYPVLTRYRCRHGEWYEQGYFKGAMLLHHVAGNPIRHPLPANIHEAAKIILRYGADPNAATEGGATTVGLLLTSLQASQAGATLPLIELLCSVGAKADVMDPDALTQSLLNSAPETTAELVKRGAVMDLRHAAGLGRLDTMEALLAQNPEAQLRDEALLFACICGQAAAAELLLRRGARGDVLIGPGGMTPRTALHEAANRGQRSIVIRLLESGADAGVVEPNWGGTAAGWAMHGGHPEIADFLSAKTSV